MDKQTLIANLEFSRGRLLGILDTIEKSGQDVNKVLAWRPAPGRAHIGWQAMHCAATHHRYLNEGLLGGAVSDEALVTHFAGGSTPSDDRIPTLAAIREQLAKQYAPLKQFVADQTPEAFDRQFMMGKNPRAVGESLLLMAWHEAHHQGQIHLTWNMYKAANGIV
jgi:uncharacterized damage-inducible protein DinB